MEFWEILLAKLQNLVGKLVFVDWIDAARSAGNEWKYLDEALESPEISRTYRAVIVGFLLKVTEDAVAIAPIIGDLTHPMGIPQMGGESIMRWLGLVGAEPPINVTPIDRDRAIKLLGVLKSENSAYKAVDNAQ